VNAVNCRLYLITPPVLPQNFEAELAAALDAGDVAAVQLRLKNLPDAQLKKPSSACARSSSRAASPSCSTTARTSPLNSAATVRMSARAI